MAPPDSAHPTPPSARQRLCRAVASIAGAEGLAAATPEGIAAEAGLPSEAFWAEFGTVEDCFLAMYDAAVADLLANVTAATGSCHQTGDANWQELLDAGFAAMLAFFAADPLLARACVVEAAFFGQAAWTRRDRVLDLFIGYLEHVRQTQAGRVPRLAPEMIVRGVHEVVVAHVARGETEELPGLLADLRYVWLVPFVGRYEASSAREADEHAHPGSG